MTLPRISIVTPSYNQGQFLERTILSVLTQEYPSLEYLVLDGGSNDNSVEVIKRHKAGITFWRSHPDGGQSEAICDGWKRATGEVLAWLNSDDYYHPGALAGVGKFFETHPEVLVLWGALAVVDEGGGVRRVKPARALDTIDLLLFKDVPNQAASFVRRRVFEELGGPRHDLNYVLDWEFWVRIALRYPASQIGFTPQVLAAATEWAGAKTSTAATRDHDEVRRILGELFARPDLPPQVRAMEKRAYARCWWRQSRTELQLGRNGPALRSLFKGLFLSPSTVGLGRAATQVRRIATAGVTARRQARPVAPISVVTHSQPPPQGLH